MKKIATIGLIATPFLVGATYSVSKGKEMYDAFSEKVSFTSIDTGGGLHFKGSPFDKSRPFSLNGFVRLNVKNSSEFRFPVVIHHLSLIDDKGNAIANGTPSPTVFELPPINGDTPGQVLLTIKVEMPLDTSDQQRAFFTELSDFITGNFDQKLRLVWKAAGRQIEYDIALKDFM